MSERAGGAQTGRLFLEPDAAKYLGTVVDAEVEPMAGRQEQQGRLGHSLFRPHSYHRFLAWQGPIATWIGLQ